MKKVLYLVAAMLFSINIMAQSPQKMSYQSVIRNSSGVLVTNQSVAIKISILQGSATGTAVYSETQTATTNANGLVSLQIGGGTVVTGSFATINWATGTYYIKTDIDPTGGNNYTVTGTSQLLSVAYALYAQSAGNPGVKGDSGVSVRGSKVIGDSLFVTLSTGKVINAGNVRGIQGVQGVQGLTGSTGSQGSAGKVGISVVNTKVIGDSLYLILSNGQFLTAGNVRGLQGIQGIQGLKGDTGMQGQQGIQGLTGNGGAKGDSGVSVRSTKVNGDSLLVTLSTGKTLNAGNVRGLQGLKGDTGVSVRTTKVNGDSLYISLSNGQVLNAGNVRGLTGATGLLSSAASAGVTPYWNGTKWILNGTNVYNNGNNIGIGTFKPDSSAALEIKDSARGLLLPRMTMAQRLAISKPATGLLVYQTDNTIGLWYYDGSTWRTNYTSTVSDIYNTLLYTNDGF